MPAGDGCLAVASGAGHAESKVELPKVSKIDTLDNNPEARLSQALRSLAAASSGQAPAEVGETLTRAFRQHHARRRARRRAAVLGTILVLSLPALLLLKRPGVPAPVASATHSPSASS